MRHHVFKAVSAGLLATGLLLPPLVYAQTGPGAKAAQTGPAAEASPEMRRYRDMQNLMQDMTKAMGAMNEQMGKGGPTPEMRKDMSLKMKRMSNLMGRMSGLIGRPSMKDAEADRQLGQMRKQMDEMSKAPSMNEPRK